jgi:hypothetical protein
LVPMPLAYWCRVPDDINAGSTGTAWYRERLK